jgi:hypothetical protein
VPHEVAPILGTYFPGLHNKQLEAPATEIAPAGHGVHSLLFVPILYVPAPHFMQEELPAGAYVPGVHGSHVSEAVSAALPIGQVPHKAAPLAENLPWEQSTQEGLAVLLAYLPAAHKPQTELD